MRYYVYLCSVEIKEHDLTQESPLYHIAVIDILTYSARNDIASSARRERLTTH